MAEDDEAAMQELATRIFDMAREGDIAGVTTYVDQGVPVNLCNDRGDTLLMLAAYHSHGELVRELLSRGADPMKANDKGQAPLAGAVFKGADDVVAALIEGGADPRAGYPSALETAQMFGRDDYVALFTTS